MEMKIRGFPQFVSENRLESSFHLCDTALIIDGVHLEILLYNAFLKTYNDRAYGGDLSPLSAYIEKFFITMQSCAIKPVVLLDGSFQADKMKKRKSRFLERLSRAEANCNKGGIYGFETSSLLNFSIFVQVRLKLALDLSLVNISNFSHFSLQTIKRLGIPVYMCAFEFNSTLSKVATDLGVPILSNTSDFLIEHPPDGLINPKTLFNGKGNINLNQTPDGKPYLECLLYKRNFLQQLFPGLEPALVPLGSVILGYQKKIDIPKNRIEELAIPAGDHDLSTRHGQIRAVFEWLSQKTVKSAIDALLAVFKERPSYSAKRLNDFIESHYLNLPPNITAFSRQSLSLEAYFTANRSTLFKRQAEVPQWAHDRFIDGKLSMLAIDILIGQVHFCRPCVEDCSLVESSYETVFHLFTLIYGLLRSDDTNPKPVSRYVRCGDNKKIESVQPAIMVSFERV